MAFEHRQDERKTKLEELRRLTKRIIEDAAAAQIALEAISLWGGPQAADFGNDEAQSAARLTETIVGLEAAQMMFATMEQPVGEYGVNVGQALTRIAAP